MAKMPSPRHIMLAKMIVEFVLVIVFALINAIIDDLFQTKFLNEWASLAYKLIYLAIGALMGIIIVWEVKEEDLENNSDAHNKVGPKNDS